MQGTAHVGTATEVVVATTCLKTGNDAAFSSSYSRILVSLAGSWTLRATEMPTIEELVGWRCRAPFGITADATECQDRVP